MALGRKISQLQSVNTAGSNDDIPIVQNGVTKKTSVEKINQEQELATVAYSNDYNDLDNTPNLAPVATSNDYNDLENTPNLAPVATSNNYNDLDNLPEIPVQITPTIQQVLEQGDTSTIPFTVSGTNSKAVHSSKGYDVQETDGITVLTTELVSKQVRHVKKVNGTEVGRTELEYQEPSIQAKITVPNKTGTMALLSDIEANQSSGLLVDYTHTANQEIYINAIDYATGIVTTTTPHGLTGTLISNVGIFVNGLNAPSTFDLRNIKTIPFEYLTTRVYVTVVNASQLKITNSSGGVISVNTTSTENNNNLDISKWHIEILDTYSIDIPNGNKKISVEYFGLAITDVSSYTDYSFYENNSVVPAISLPNTYSYIPHVNFLANGNNKNSIYFTKRMQLNLIDERMYMETWSQNNYRASGSNIPNISMNNFYKHPQIDNSIYVAGRLGSSGISKIKTFSNNVLYSFFSNGTKIKVYKS